MAERTHERIYRTLRLRIMHGEFAPAQTLTLRQLAADFGTSMMPVRDSLRRLVAEGALSLASTGRVATPDPAPERLEELVALRGLIEPELASRALPRVYPALIERLTAVNSGFDDIIAAGDSVAYIRTNLEFHRTLYLRAQSPAMLALVETVWLQLGPAMRRLYERRRRSDVAHHHRTILAALRAGDEPGLRLAIRTDVRQGLKMLIG